MGNYQLCDFCGNLHEKRIKKMCQICEDSYIKVRSIVEANPNIMVYELSTQTGISVSRILAFVRNGYFIMKEGGDGFTV